MKKLIIIAIALFSCLPAFSQQDVIISQYMFNGLLLNPAYAGSKDYVMTTLLHRSQWVGLEGAPVSQVATIHGPLKDEVNAFGLTISNDHIGVTNQLDIYGSYAYHIKFSPKATLSLGLKGGISYYTARVQDLQVWDEGDELFTGGTRTNLLPNAGAGAYFYSRTFYAGISVPQLISYDPQELFNIDVSKAHIPHKKRHYLFNTGYAIEANPDLVIKPSVLVKYVDNAPVQADLNLHFLIHELFWVGGSYRTGDSFVGMLELQLSKKLRIGYAYDYTLTRLGDYSSGTHEFMIGYDFGYDILKTKTPRYF